MSIGVSGPIGWPAFEHYAICAAVSIYKMRNLQTAACKICGCSLASDQGRAAALNSLEGFRQTYCYLCEECIARIGMHARAWYEFVAASKAGTGEAVQ
jgi:hypothetical protein